MGARGRRGEWHGGIYQLCQIDLADPRIVLPRTFFSYLGLACARCEHRWPVLGFLPSSHAVNIHLGRWRAALLLHAVAEKGV